MKKDGRNTKEFKRPVQVKICSICVSEIPVGEERKKKKEAMFKQIIDRKYLKELKDISSQIQ